MNLILTALVVFLILIINEINWRKRKIHGEFSRKFVHISVGSLIAFSPFYLSWTEIYILGGAFIVVVLLSKYLKIFQAIHSVQRPTWGEICFALAVILVGLITHDKWLYAASLLQMSLADGLAGVIGMRFGGKYNYIILGHTKSIIGTLTFFVVSIAVLFSFMHFNYLGITPIYIVLISFITSVLENLSVFGLDNLSVPIVTALLLTSH